MLSILDLSNPTTKRALSVAKALVKKNHEVCLINPAIYSKNASEVLIEKKDGVIIYHPRYYGKPLSAHESISPRTLGRAIGLLYQSLKVDFDVIHAFKPLIPGAVGFAAKLLKNKPLVIDVDDWEGSGGYANFYPSLTGKMIDIFERTTPRYANSVTVASIVLAERLSNFGVKQDRIFYIPNGVDSERFHPVNEASSFDNSLSENAQTFMYSGAIQKSYDLDLLINAFRKVVQLYPEAKCLIGGSGSEKLALEDLVKKSGLEKSVLFTGWIPDLEYWPFLSKANIFVVPVRDSLIQRGACHGKIIEYMSMGRPVITGKISESANYIEHKKSGYLVEPGNVEALSNAMLELIQDRHLAKSIGENARKRVIERYTWDIIASKFEKVYEQLV